MTTEIYTLSLHDALPIWMRLGKLGLSLTGSYLGYQFQNLFLGEEAKAANRRQFGEKASRRVQEELGSMKDRKSTRLNSSHLGISYAVFCLKKKNKKEMHK